MPMPVFETDALKKIKDLKDSYDKSFRQFCNLIKKEEDKLTFLNFRLDFSEYYEFLFVRVRKSAKLEKFCGVTIRSVLDIRVFPFCTTILVSF